MYGSWQGRGRSQELLELDGVESAGSCMLYKTRSFQTTSIRYACIMYTIIRSTPSSIVFKLHERYHDNDNDNDKDKEDSNRSYIINTIHHLQKEVKNVYEQNSN
jgi:hypothetical protein